MDDIVDNEIEPFVVHLSENGDVNDSWDEMYKHPGICKYNFLEILYINALNTVKRVYNRYLRFLKKGLRKPGVPLDSIFALYRFDNYLLSANEVKIN